MHICSQVDVVRGLLAAGGHDWEQCTEDRVYMCLYNIL